MDTAEFIGPAPHSSVDGQMLQEKQKPERQRQQLVQASACYNNRHRNGPRGFAWSCR